MFSATNTWLNETPVYISHLQDLFYQTTIEEYNSNSFTFLTLENWWHIYVTFDPYVVQSVFLALQSFPNACNWCQAQAHKKLMVFWPPFSLNNK